jgi:anti-sigma factor RsiW
MTMNCEDVRLQLGDHRQGRLEASAADALQAHLADCPHCAHVAAAEAELTDVLERRLPQYPASFALKRRLATQWPAAAPRRAWWRPAPLAALALAALALLVVTPVVYDRQREARVTRSMVAEAVNDHLRVLSSQRPLEIESGGIHQVKPWFEGRLDFAPVVAFDGDADLPLRGGAVGYFFDRKAAVFVYARRLHPVSLIVFRADGLAWPRGDGTPATDDRGFSTILWRRAALGYALVSDIDARELSTLAARFRPAP